MAESKNFLFLKSLKSDLKNLVSNAEIETLLGKVENILNPDSEAYNTFILVKGRYKLLSKEKERNTLYPIEISVELGKIRDSIISFIDGLKSEDLNQTEADHLNFKKEPHFIVTEVNERIELLSNENLCVKLDNAPDGLLRVFKNTISEDSPNADFKDHTTVFEAVKKIEDQLKTINEFKDLIFLKSSIKNNHSSNIVLNRTIFSLFEGVSALAPLRNLILTKYSGKEEINYTIDSEISTFFPGTILSQILNDKSPLDKVLNMQADVNPNLRNQKLITQINYNIRQKFISKKIALELNSNSLNLVSFEKNNIKDGLDIKFIKPIIEEDLTFLQPTYSIYAYNTAKHPDKSGILSNINSYEKDLYHVAKSNKIDTLLVKYSFSKKKTLEGFFLFLEEIANIHKRGLVHGDISPKNIILTKKGFLPIDSLDVKEGEIGPALTLNYCAPEQVFNKPVSAQSDIYNFGLLLVAFFNGLIFGKLETFLFPASKSQLVSTVSISSPEVLIYFNENFSIQHKLEWVKLIESCIKFNPEDRVNSIDELYSKFKKLVDIFPEDDCFNEVHFDFGKFTFIDSGENCVRLVRVIGDNDDNHQQYLGAWKSVTTARNTLNPFHATFHRCLNCGWSNPINLHNCEKCRKALK